MKRRKVIVRKGAFCSICHMIRAKPVMLSVEPKTIKRICAACLKKIYPRRCSLCNVPTRDLKERGGLIKHHIIYYPAGRTIALCRLCHWRIHFAGVRPDLNPFGRVFYDDEALDFNNYLFLVRLLILYPKHVRKCPFGHCIIPAGSRIWNDAMANLSNRPNEYMAFVDAVSKSCLKEDDGGVYCKKNPNGWLDGWCDTIKLAFLPEEVRNKVQWTITRNSYGWEWVEWKVVHGHENDIKKI